MKKQTILCVDDEIDNTEALERLLRSKYNILKAESGHSALKILEQHPEPIAVIVTDQKMPGMTGVEFLAQSMKTHPDSLRILLTGYTDIESIIAAVNSGQIYRYINKPWDPVDFVNTVHRAVEQFQLKTEIKEKNKALEKAYQELQTLDQAKNNFMILINHELKTPLTSILSYSELLMENKLDEESFSYLKKIYKSADKLNQIVKDVLLIMQSETQTLKIKSSPFDCDQIKVSLSQEMENLKSQKNINLNYAWINKKEDLKIIGEQRWIEEVFSRVIQNAVKFGFPQSIIHVNYERVRPHRVQFEINNQGPSISDSTLQKIIRPFFIDEDVMKHSVGTGLGLSVCQALLNVHGSELKVKNTPQGVAVLFELPTL